MGAGICLDYKPEAARINSRSRHPTRRGSSVRQARVSSSLVAAITWDLPSQRFSTVRSERFAGRRFMQSPIERRIKI
jgi:hypothetical protein